MGWFLLGVTVGAVCGFYGVLIYIKTDPAANR